MFPWKIQCEDKYGMLCPEVPFVELDKTASMHQRLRSLKHEQAVVFLVQWYQTAMFLKVQSFTLCRKKFCPFVNEQMQFLQVYRVGYATFQAYFKKCIVIKTYTSHLSSSNCISSQHLPSLIPFPHPQCLKSHDKQAGNLQT